MKKKIDRVMFWFKNGDEKIAQLTNGFSPLADLLTRLLNEHYEGGRIRFINIHFCTLETYRLYPGSLKFHTYTGEDSLRYNDVIDMDVFLKMNATEQAMYVWKRSCEIFGLMSEATKKPALQQAVEYAYKKGIDIQLNPDYKLLETEGIIHGEPVKVALWFKFRPDAVYSKIVLQKANTVIFEKEIDKGALGNEFFPTIYKKLEIQKNTIILKGHYEIDYLPLKIKIGEEVVKGI